MVVSHVQNIGTDEFYLNLCLQSAWQNQLITLPNPAVSALILDQYGTILSLESHQECGKPHAEVLALQKAYAKLSGDCEILRLSDSAQIHQYLLKCSQNLFNKTTIYVSLEPCGSHKCGRTPSCTSLLKALKPKRIIIATQDRSQNAKGGAEELEQCGILVTKAWETKNLTSIHQCANSLLYPFNALQTKGRFLLYKYACRLDGSINGGQISSKAAQSKMHDYRAKADFLLLSGKTIREDKPTLDARFASLESKRPPNILILTRDNNFSTDAPLFDIPNREVKILNQINPTLQNINGFIMCEGGAELLSALQPHIDMLLVILQPSFNADFTLTMHLRLSFHLVHSMQIGEDLFLWLLPKNQPML
ncbi:dihydrofolate reductase family protein [Helicobacter ganmani]|uniref:dihydrofolate reductase family protein n=1 Tax=Helicobacter TaxID=209 RepID=UPI002601E7F1|nr:dihydrofolate reductase family protein [Helicobacter sp. UBA3407]